MEKGKTTTTHLRASVAGLLNQSDSHLEGMLSDSDGEVMSVADARQWLLEQQAEGVEVIRCCSFDECPDFDPITGCPGHVNNETGEAIQ